MRIQGPGLWALGLAALFVCGGPTHAQETPTSNDETPANADDDDDDDDDDLSEEEIKKLREEADEELGKQGDGTEEGDLRLEADEAIEEDDTLYLNLLDAFSSISNRLNAFNPRITVFGDVLGRVSAGSHELVEDGISRDDRVGLREVEIDFRADIDPYAKGVLILAAEEHEPGEYEFTIEEGYFTLETIPYGFKAKLGRYRVPIGQYNRLHTHDLPQSVRPLVIVDIFGEEGFVEQGAEISWLAPFAPLTLSFNLLNGENEGAFAGGNSDDPVYMGRAEYFLQATDTIFLTTGATFLFGYNDAPDPLTDSPSSPNQETHVYSADMIFKWQPSQFTSLVVQGEVFWVKKEVANRGTEYGFGGFVFAQYQFSQRFYVGARYDYSNYDEGTEDSDQYAVSAYASFYTSEFLRFRVGYEHRERSTTNGGEPDLDTVFLQATFVFGSHPVEPFWFNK